MLIVGTGALATLVAERAFKHGIPFQLYGPASERTHALALRFPGCVVTEAHSVRSEQTWLIAVKTWQNAEKVEKLSEAVKARALLAIQNGLAPELDFTGLCSGPVERALCSYGVRTDGPGKVLGGESGELLVKRGSVFSGVLGSLDFRCREVPDMTAAVWHKLAVNASLNTTASLFDLTNGEVLEHPTARPLAQAASIEVRTVAVAAGVNWGNLDPWTLVSGIARQTSSNICSTLADLRRGLPTEYDAINKSVLQAATRIGLRVPALEQIDSRFAMLEKVCRSAESISTRDLQLG